MCSRPDELEHESIFGLQRLRRVPVAGVCRIAQEIRFLNQFEAGSLDFCLQERLLDPVQRARLGNARSRSARMVSNHPYPSRPQRCEYCSVHAVSVDPQMPEVVVVEHQRHEVETAVSHLGRHWLFECPDHWHDVTGL